MLEEAEDFERQFLALDGLSREYDELFRELVGTDEISTLLGHCDARWETTELWKQISDKEAASDIQDFLSSRLFFHIRGVLRRWQTRNKNEESTASLRDVGDEFATVFADEERIFEGCFSGWMHSLPAGSRKERELKKEVGTQIERMHAELGLTSGEFQLAEMLSASGRREGDGELGPEESMVVCSARDIFEAVKDGLPRAGAGVALWQESAWQRATKFSEAINALELPC